MSGPSSPFGGGWNKFRDFAEGGLPFGGHMPTSFGDIARGGLPFGGHNPFTNNSQPGQPPPPGSMPTPGSQPIAFNHGGPATGPAGTPSTFGTGTQGQGMTLPPGMMQTNNATMPTPAQPAWGNIGYPPGGGMPPQFGDMATDAAAGMNTSNGPIMHTPLFDPNSSAASQGSVPLANSPAQNYSPVGTGAMPPGVSPDMITQTLNQAGAAGRK